MRAAMYQDHQAIRRQVIGTASRPRRFAAVHPSALATNRVCSTQIHRIRVAGRPCPRSSRRRTLPPCSSAPAPIPKFGDYQSNALMALAKERKMNPRQLAADVLARLDVAEWCEKVEIAGAGFLNFRLKPAALANALASRRARRASVFRKGRAAPHRRRGFQLAQRRQADARRPHPLDHPGRFAGARAPAAGPPRHHRQPYRRLGHAVRQIARRLENAA